METRATYTPGPWAVDGGQVRDAHGDALASVPYTLGDETDQANARLIAAAPELADAAAALLARLDWAENRGLPLSASFAERDRLAAAVLRVTP